MIVRELTGDVYFGTPKGIEIINGEITYNGEPSKYKTGGAK